MKNHFNDIKIILDDMLPLKHGIKDIKDVTIYISCVKGSLGALRGGGGEVSACAESETRERKQKRNYLFFPSFLARRASCLYLEACLKSVPATNAVQTTLTSSMTSTHAYVDWSH